MSFISANFMETNSSLGEKVLNWILSQIDYSQIKKGYPICFEKNVSFFLNDLSCLNTCPTELKSLVMKSLVDQDMKDDLERSKLINWCPNVKSLVPIKVPRDGNCLLHAVVKAIWGLEDTKLFFRRLLCATLKADKNGRFHSRWSYHRQMQISQVLQQIIETGGESLNQEWDEITESLDSENATFPYRFLEPIHVYTLANIIRRPIIIITNSSIRAFSGFSLQDNDMGGVYLPLEWDWNNTCHTPVLLGFSENHFCPLLFTELPQQASPRIKSNLTPLVTGTFEQMPVRFLLQGEEPEVGELLKKYLKVRETLMRIENSRVSILCAELDTPKIPEDLNLLQAHLWYCERHYQNQGQQHQHQQPVPPQVLQHQHTEHLASAQHFRLSQPLIREQLQTGPVGAPPTTHFVPLNIPPSVLPPLSQNWQDQSSLSTSLSKKCIVPHCAYFGDPETNMMCSTCFKKYTIRESRRPHMSSSSFDRQLPTAPLASIHPEQEQQYFMSMMNDRCKMGCGFRCSVNTHPYCHECYEKINKKALRKEHSALQPGIIVPGSLTLNASTSGRAVPFLPSPQLAQSGMNIPERQLLHPGTDQNQFPLSSTMPSSAATMQTTPVNQTQSSVERNLTSLKADPLIITPAPAAPASPLPVGAGSPTQALTGVSLTPPLTPPDDNELFGSGHHSPHISSQKPPDMGSIGGVEEQAQMQVSTLKAIEQCGAGPNAENNTNNAAARQNSVENLINKTRARCISENCTEEALQKNLCAKCYIHQSSKRFENSGIGKTPVPSAQVPAHILGRRNLESQESSLTCHLPTNITMNPNQNVYNWLVENPVSASMGLPERQGSELGEAGDLIPSGEACQSFTKRCVATNCRNPVEKPGQQLCTECTNILIQAKRGESHSLQGTRTTETRLTQPLIGGYSAPLARQQALSILPDPHPITVPHHKRGKLCIVPGCSYFGDPKQADMCTKHYQEKCTHPLPGNMAQVTRAFPVPGPYNITFSSPRGLFIGMPETSGSASLMHGMVSVPPPSFPIPESTSIAHSSCFAGVDEQFTNVYNRVSRSQQLAKTCQTPGCNNYGNSSKGGFCNSCYENESDLLVRRTILGDEECG